MRIMRAIACALLASSATGCATVVYPKRVALPEEKRAGIDWTMVATDVMFTGGLGLIVDFCHGTIYRPPDGYRGRGFDRGLCAPRGDPGFAGDP